MVVPNTLPSVEEVEAKIAELNGKVAEITTIHFELRQMWNQWLKAVGALNVALNYAREHNLVYKEAPDDPNLVEPPSSQAS